MFVTRFSLLPSSTTITNSRTLRNRKNFSVGLRVCFFAWVVTDSFQFPLQPELRYRIGVHLGHGSG